MQGQRVGTSILCLSRHRTSQIPRCTHQDIGSCWLSCETLLTRRAERHLIREILNWTCPSAKSVPIPPFHVGSSEQVLPPRLLLNAWRNLSTCTALRRFGSRDSETVQLKAVRVGLHRG